MKLKVCGMKYQENIKAVASLQPDYLGFIFHEESPRNFELDNISQLSKQTKKVGVFVNKSIQFIINKIEKYELNAIQLHGEESPEFCSELLHAKFDSTFHPVEIIKVFSIKDKFDFSVLKLYEDVCDYFLFDTKGKLPGGNGYTFNWNVLKDYPSTKPYFLSGGIGLNELEKIKEFYNNSASKFCYALDVNSKFEIKPGLKNIEELKTFKEHICHVERSRDISK